QLHLGQAAAALARGGGARQRSGRVGERRAGDPHPLGHQEPDAGGGLLRRRRLWRRGLPARDQPGADGGPAGARPAHGRRGRRAPRRRLRGAGRARRAVADGVRPAVRARPGCRARAAVGPAAV
ncbi:MAG: hypothetical protein AVDCRST_MAG16-1488, partial [uncultured Frankineae bacterium]